MIVIEKIKCKIVFITCLLFTQACTQTTNTISGMLKVALVGQNDVVLTEKDINDSPYASIYASIGDSSKSYVVLGYVEQAQNFTNSRLAVPEKQLKWITKDSAMLVTQSGRLIKTTGLYQGDLLNVTSEQPDPLSLNLTLQRTPKTWTRTVDWSPGYHFNYQLESTFSFIESQQLTINNLNHTVDYYVEHVSVPTLNIQYENQFWLETKTGAVLKSNQKIAPSLPYLAITLLKPYSA